jgi:hypothetical protein
MKHLMLSVNVLIVNAADTEEYSPALEMGYVPTPFMFALPASL